MKTTSIASIEPEEIPIALVISETQTQVVIRCPYCGERHFHGKGEGHRISHCVKPEPTNRGYIIKNADASKAE